MFTYQWILIIFIVVLLIISLCIIAFYPKNNTIQSYTGSFPSNKTIQLINNNTTSIYFTFITIMDSFNNIYTVTPSSYINGYDPSVIDPSGYHPIYQWDKDHPIQLSLPSIQPFGYLGIHAGMHDPNANDSLYSDGLQVRLLSDSNGKLVYIYSGNTRPSDITVTIPSSLKNPITPTPSTFPILSTFNPSQFNQYWPDTILIQYPPGTVTQMYIHNSTGDIYSNITTQKLYFHNEVNKYMPVAATTIDASNNTIQLITSGFPIGEYINLYVYSNNDSHCITFYHDGNFIDPIVIHSNQADISLNITYKYTENYNLYKVRPGEIPVCTFVGDRCMNPYIIKPIYTLLGFHPILPL